MHYPIVARGSTTEIANWFMKCRDLAYFPPPVAVDLEANCQEIVKMLNTMIGTLRRKTAPSLHH